ncbi:MAG TPA: hypothetical protein VK442_10475 [Xanthobacteraceae bacterium]|nr:hypothetical protein [Xanthobacteraceae bacterium]
MAWLPIEWTRDHRHPTVPGSDLSPGLRIASNVLRALFIALLVVITLRVSMPQNETIWTIYDTPGDVVRMALGLAVCVWLVVQFFAPPKDIQHYRIWFYLGLAAVPFAVICLIAVW